MMDSRQKLKFFVGFCVACVSAHVITGLDNKELNTLLEECLVMAIFLQDNRTAEVAYMAIADNAIVYYMKCLEMNKSKSAVLDMVLYGSIAKAYEELGKYHKAIEFYETHLSIAKENADSRGEARSYEYLGNVHYLMSEYHKAIEYNEKHLNISKEIADKLGEENACGNLGKVYHMHGEYHKSIHYHKRSLDIAKQIGDRNGEGHSYGGIGIVFSSLEDYHKSIEYHEKSLCIAKEIADRKLERNAYGNLGIVYNKLGKYQKSIEYLEKSLCIAKEIGIRNGEAQIHQNLGVAYDYLGKYHKAIEHYEQTLSMVKENCNRHLEGAVCGSLGTVYLSLSEYKKAKEYNDRCLSIYREIGDRRMEGNAYHKLGETYQRLGEYYKSIQYHETSLSIAKEIGNRKGEAQSNMGLGNTYASLGEYHKAIKYYEKALSIVKDIGDRNGEGKCYGNLGTAYRSLGEYHKAIEYHETGLSIVKDIGDRHGEGLSYQFLGNVYYSLGQYHQAIEYHKKLLSIAKEIGDRRGEGQSYGNLGNAYYSLREYIKAGENYEQSLSIAKEIADRSGEARCYGNLGSVYIALGKYQKAIEYHEKDLSIAQEIADRRGEGQSYGNLGTAYSSVGEYNKAIEYLEKSLCILKEIDDKVGKAIANYTMASVYLKIPTPDLNKAKEHLTESIRSYEELFDDLKEKYDSKISILDTFIQAYKRLSTVYIDSGQTEDALLICERGRARALRDLLSLKYIIDKATTSERKPLEIADVLTITSACNGCILFCDIHPNKLTAHFWVVAPQRQPIIFYDEKKEVEDLGNIVTNLSEEDQQELSNQGYFQHLVEQSYIDIMREGMQCEDRSIGGVEFEQQETSISGEAAVSVFQALTRCVYDEEEEDKPLEMLYARLISPVQSHLVEDEIVIIPDGPLFMIPFAALQDPGTGKFLSETKRIRLAPSLTTLKLLQECLEDHHCKSGALIVGNPTTGRVKYRGREKQFTSLPGAEEEARRIGDLLGVEPLIGEQATKQAILGKLRDGVSVIHFAAHGSEKNGQILLAPSVLPSTSSIPEEKDYILTMKEAQEIGVRAQLVVLSCCHSGQGEIKSEGVVGMTRAFLAAGARAVVASLWAIEDEATKLFMLRFYSHLKTGETASRSLQHAMKEMRETEKYKKPKYWAAFFLIGDDVTISV